ESLMQDEIFDPLKMNSAGFGPPKRISGHTTSNGKLAAANFDNPETLGPAATVHCSLEDWGKFLSVHLGKIDGFLKPETLSRLHAPPPGSTYAMGWIVIDLGERGVLLSHDGSNTLWYARVILIPKQGIVILVALNSNDVEACEAATQLAVKALQE
ncbi:MAG TPA: serine hydrolase domain-containing protein, partial [Tepidisphaeraceae bacterium]|nr:serine hydrolase domain-containing protein [Tepidisphaeraceae bacterium]